MSHLEYSKTLALVVQQFDYVVDRL